MKGAYFFASCKTWFEGKVVPIGQSLQNDVVWLKPNVVFDRRASKRPLSTPPWHKVSEQRAWYLGPSGAKGGGGVDGLMGSGKCNRNAGLQNNIN